MTISTRVTKLESAPRNVPTIDAGARLRRHRALLITRDCARLEVSIGCDVIGLARTEAKREGCPLWQIVEAAIAAYCRLPETN